MIAIGTLHVAGSSIKFWTGQLSSSLAPVSYMRMKQQMLHMEDEAVKMSKWMIIVCEKLCE